MTMQELSYSTGIRKMSHVGSNVVVEFTKGGCRPATEQEWRMWQLLTKGRVDDELREDRFRQGRI